MPPIAYLNFCERQPTDCGADAAQVLQAVAHAEAERAALFARELSGPAAPGAATESVAGAAPAASAAAQDAPAIGPELWSTLNKINDFVNRAIRPQTDRATYGREDVWATPLASGHRAGDCEDYVLEKERALVAAGVSRDALSIATVTTRWGEVHAVLLVNTTQGEVVLDNLQPRVLPWWQAPYRWGKRQVPGKPFEWVSVDAPTLLAQR